MTSTVKTKSEKAIVLISAGFFLFFIIMIINASTAHQAGSPVASTTTEAIPTSPTQAIETANSAPVEKPVESAQTGPDYEFVDASTSQKMEELKAKESIAEKATIETAKTEIAKAEEVQTEVPSNTDALKETEPVQNAVQETASTSPSATSLSDDFAYENPVLTGRKEPSPDDIKTCSMKEWGIAFTCDMTWETTNNQNTKEIAIVLSKDPLVTMNFIKMEKNIHFISQLNKFFFEDSHLYQDGFAMEKVNFAGFPAIYVKGFDKKDPNTRRRDYFFINNNKLLNVSFTFSPEKEDKGKAVIQEVKKTFVALDI